jgi:hypothetical protein
MIMSEFFVNTERVLPILLVIFIAVLSLILLVRLVFLFLINLVYKRYLSLKKFGKKTLPTARKNFVKEDEELMRIRLKIPRAHSQVKAEIRAKKAKQQSENYEILTSFEQELREKEMNRVDIVDFVKPIGRWTAMILGQKLVYLIQSAQSLNKRGDKGFWASMIEAKERQAGKQHARGR